MKLQGIFPPITTPFDHAGNIYAAKLQHNIEQWNRTTLAGYVVTGSTGESVLLTAEEKVIFEFWELPPWAKVRDSEGKLTQAPEMGAYVEAMVNYCPVSREKTGAALEIVGIQNGLEPAAETWRRMAPALRRGLDDAGFRATKIHMHNPAMSSGGVAAGKAFREDAAVWKTIDYAASNLYDYQSHFYDPDGFDAALSQLRDATSGKPFLAVELCVNNGSFQSPAYRVAFAMGQLYHKVLTHLDACGVMYCWTLLNVVQPSYGWTRTLFVPDPEH